MSADVAIDDAVILAAAGGDSSAFAKVVDTYRAAICSVALAIVGDLATSEDVAQEVFVAAWRRLNELRNPQSVGPWLRQITRNRANDALRKRHRDVPADPLAHHLVAADDLGEATLACERRAVLEECLQELPLDAREILLLFYREGRSVRQVSRLLELSEVAAKKRLSRARAQLRQDVLERFSEAAQNTAPRAAFTTAVITAITVGSPSIASAATGGVLATGGKLGKLALGGAGAGAGLGIAGVLVGMHRVRAGARTDAERARLRTITIVSVAHVAALTLLVLPVVRYLDHPIALWSWYAALIGGFAVIHRLWIPRVIAQRLAAERREDPTAARRQRLQRWMGLAGLLVGAIGSGIGVWFALYRG